MILKELKPRKALNKAFLKVKPNRTEIELFKANLTTLLDRINDTETEEFHKNLISDFLKKTYYDPNHFINTKGRNDLVIHIGDEKSSVGVIIEVKKPTNKAEMITSKKLNVKAFQELVLYYLRERITQKNIEIKHLIVTNINEWYIFDASIFDRLFAQDKKFVRQFEDFESLRLADNKTEFFYKSVAEPFIANIESQLEFTYFNLQDFQKIARNKDKYDDNALITLFKILTPEHLLKLPFKNDSNNLDKGFYKELLHIIGLTETKKIIGRNEKENRNLGSLLESTIIQLETKNKISRLEKPHRFGKNNEEKLFNLAIELCITWINRVLFLKLLEAQLIKYHKGDRSYSFLNIYKIKTFDDLDDLFFQVLALPYNERSEEVKKSFEKVPYLNSSLFEPTEIEHATLSIGNLKSDNSIPVFTNTVLKDQQGRKLNGKKNTLEYLFAFLDSYDFSSEGSEEIQEENKSLINASVLGLIFEKINGYKDGSFFTPGYITMYMCRETIRKAVLKKFNETKNWKCETIEELYNKIEDIKEANQIVNSIRICDPAVGSGHFLVSALNEIIALKHDLKILQDRNGKRLKEYHVEVENDELIVTDEDGKLFEYNPSNKESQRIQETLFHEKENIIENCLFGVDVNPHSVKICSLRLWIELLKNAYYKNNTELETLPNIDINIKWGNSLISRFTIDADIRKVFKKGNILSGIKEYRNAVATYRNAKNKDEKRRMEKLISEIKSDFRSEIDTPFKKKMLNAENKITTLATTINTKKQWGEKVDKKLITDLEKANIAFKKLELEKDDIETNKIYDNAFEWRFEFPEVLNDKGDFIGFDCIVGNPPYVFGGSEGISISEKKYYKKNYECGSGKVNLFTLFIERAFLNLRSSGQFAYIIPNTFLRVTSYDSTRRFLVNNSQINSIYDFGDKVFDDAVTTAIVITATKGNYEDYQINILNSKNGGLLNKHDIINNDFIISTNVKQNSSPLLQKLKSNIKLGTICKEMIFGVVITKNKDEVVSSEPREGWKPFLEGREIGSYYIQEIKQWLNYDPQLLHRPRTKDIFEVPEKILIQRITGGIKPLKAAYDNKGLYNKESINNIILNDNSPVHIKFVLAILNSKLINWFYVNQFTNESNLTVNLSKMHLSQIPLVVPNKNDEEKIITLVDYVLLLKANNGDSTFFERLLDVIMYEIYLPEITINNGVEILRYIGDLPTVENAGDLKVIEKIQKELSDSNHQISVALLKSLTVDEFNIIEGRK
ncbi:Eco57I restriction-modification methylase domain-containing protein [Chryseobacterium sp. CCH4-E10]|uniref:DUF7149 domain-containing protein n=1 Tax=Chryseobacterium sp. CCH4-E10 TaxID=1768758 RepID=UPI0009E76E9C|nr:TaqI-like C-terminal specificity domain-containing protein [Chryseobacterium sp. CCH4-E10]